MRKKLQKLIQNMKSVRSSVSFFCCYDSFLKKVNILAFDWSTDLFPGVQDLLLFFAPPKFTSLFSGIGFFLAAPY